MLVDTSSLACTLYPRSESHSSTEYTATLDATTDYVAVVVKAPKTGTIDSVIVRTGSSSTLVGTLSCQIQTLDASGDPSGTAYGSCAQVDMTNPAANTNYTFSSLGCSATVGDYIAIRIWISALTSGSTGLMTGQAGISFSGGIRMPYTSVRSTGTGAGTKQASGAASIVYSGSLYYDIPGLLPCSDTVSESLDSDGTLRRAGNRFALPFAASVVGLYAVIDNDTDTTTLKLYDTDGTTVLGTCTLVSAARAGTTQGLFVAPFDSGAAVLLRAGVGPYRCVVETNNTSATAVGVRGLENIPSLAALDGISSGQSFYGTTHDGTNWTDYASANAVKIYSVGLLINKFDDGTGGGRASLNLGGIS